MKSSSPFLLHVKLFALLAITLASEATQGSSELACFYDSGVTLFCTWIPDGTLTEVPCQLHAELQDPSPDHWCCKGKCKLCGVGPRRCDLAFNNKTNIPALTYSDRLTLTVSCQTGENWTMVKQEKKFSPFNNIQMRPPDTLELVNDTGHVYNLTWRLSVSSHYLNEKREYEVRFRAQNKHSYNKENFTFISIKQDQEWVKFDKLLPDSEYEAAVRVKPGSQSGFKGKWSNWSKTITWRTHPNESAALVAPQPMLLAVIGSSCTALLILVILLLNSRTLKWFKKFLKSHIPDPAKFFPPLGTIQGGDVQKWFSSPFSMSSYCVSNISPEISVLEVMQKKDQESQLLLPKLFITSGGSPETSGHSVSSCFTNQGYFFFHLPNSFEIEPCQVYFTYEPFTQESSSSEDGDSYRALPSPDHCMLVDNTPLFPSHFLHPTEGTQGFQNRSFVGETEDIVSEVRVPSETPPSDESASLTAALEQNKKRNENNTVLESSECPDKAGVVFSSTPKHQGVDAIQMVEGVRETAPQVNSIDIVDSASSSSSQPVPLSQEQIDDVRRIAFSSQDPNTGAYLSLRELQSQYSHCSV
ncbi:interleukin-2 receptor subunit beta [Alligator sinensis]|uniref:Interleukin-2 receptor subunit beta n=1 Tax=Alligator sinensis TaxID=38654 RepID=A0A3Q0GS98_ALLSI|nr:interleukin-2 receptor subunit beta [Alligator sinensis]